MCSQAAAELLRAGGPRRAADPEQEEARKEQRQGRETPASLGTTPRRVQGLCGILFLFLVSVDTLQRKRVKASAPHLPTPPLLPTILLSFFISP